ncbi:MAG: hypothetical protein KatS3mg110_0258 [Pirellulaceae bacterium]|nr:MAG: hypothetical protein KatS3mg110_0258 [Pirellulaceae bacterium]
MPYATKHSAYIRGASPAYWGVTEALDSEQESTQKSRVAGGTFIEKSGRQIPGLTRVVVRHRMISGYKDVGLLRASDVVICQSTRRSWSFKSTDQLSTFC